jgi:hypothetical protein
LPIPVLQRVVQPRFAWWLVLASLTKVVATTTAVMQLVGQGTLRLDEPIARWRGEDRQNVTIADLLVADRAGSQSSRLADGVVCFHR